MTNDNTSLEDVIADIDRIIRNSGHDLLNGNTLQVSRVIAARLTDQHKLRPRDKVYVLVVYVLVRVSMRATEERWAFSDILGVYTTQETLKSRLLSSNWLEGKDYLYLSNDTGFPMEQYRIYEREVE